MAAAHSSAGQKALRTAMQTRVFDPVYYFHGAEEYLKDEAVRQLIETAVEPATRDFNLEILRAGDIGLETVTAHQRALGRPPVAGLDAEMDARASPDAVHLADDPPHVGLAQLAIDPFIVAGQYMDAEGNDDELVHRRRPGRFGGSRFRPAGGQQPPRQHHRPSREKAGKPAPSSGIWAIPRRSEPFIVAALMSRVG